MIDYQRVRNLVLPDVRHTYTEQDTMLYALGIGLGENPCDKQQLRYVFEKDLHALPSMAVVLASPGAWMRQPDLGIDYLRMVHGEQGLIVHAPIPPKGTVIGKSRITHVVDKGVSKGALVQIEKIIINADDNQVLATVEMQVFCRSDGGFATVENPGDKLPEPIPKIPCVDPDHYVDYSTRVDAALLYRLSGDYNPLHADPEIAAQAGFSKPILHGLATFGMTLNALLRTVLKYDETRLLSMRTRFSGPVIPGDTLRTTMWIRDENIHFQVRALERDVVVISAGIASIRG